MGKQGSLVAAAERKVGKVAAGEAPDLFEKMLEKPCSNDAYPINHLYKDYSLMKSSWVVDRKWESNSRRRNMATLKTGMMSFLTLTTTS